MTFFWKKRLRCFNEKNNNLYSKSGKNKRFTHIGLLIWDPYNVGSLYRCVDMLCVVLNVCIYIARKRVEVLFGENHNAKKRKIRFVSSYDFFCCTSGYPHLQVLHVFEPFAHISMECNFILLHALVTCRKKDL